MAQSRNRDQEGAGARVPRGKLEEAMQDVAERRRDLIQNQQLDNDHDPRLVRGFHAAVMNYYVELELYSDETQVASFWEEAQMWPDGSGGMVCGLDAIEDWMDRRQDVEVSRPGLGRGNRTKPVRVPMPPDIALRASRMLDRAAKQLGLGIKVGVPVESDPTPV